MRRSSTRLASAQRQNSIQNGGITGWGARKTPDASRVAMRFAANSDASKGPSFSRLRAQLRSLSENTTTTPSESASPTVQRTTPGRRRRLSELTNLSTPVVREVLRNDALHQRLKELESEILQLKRALTTDQYRDDVEMLPSDCDGCSKLLRQKAYQADYFQAKLLRTRESMARCERNCAQLKEVVESLKMLLSNAEHNFKAEADKLYNNASIYKARSERLERWNQTALRGLHNDVNHLRSKLVTVEKDVLQTEMQCFNWN